MKKIIFTLLTMMYASLLVQSQPTIPIRLAGRVTSVELFANPGFIEGCTNATKRFEFTAVITVSGACTVQYKWERSDGAIDSNAPHILRFTSAGTKTVKTTWSISRAEYSGWQAISITSPSRITSNKAAFKINCCVAGDNCKTNPLITTACTESLFTSFKNLATNVGTRICNTTLNFPSVSSTMPENCFSRGTTGVVSYTTFYQLERNPIELRVIWGAVAGNYTYYGVCPPEPIIFPRPGGYTENHVFAAKLIKQSDYQSFTGSDKSYPGLASVPAIRIADIANISAPTIENSTGYMNTTEPVSYQDIYSSKGIIVTVRLKNGTSHICYLINNYDGAGTLTWKQKNPACVGK